MQKSCEKSERNGEFYFYHISTVMSHKSDKTDKMALIKQLNSVGKFYKNLKLCFAAFRTIFTIKVYS